MSVGIRFASHITKPVAVNDIATVIHEVTGKRKTLFRMQQNASLELLFFKSFKLLLLVVVVVVVVIVCHHCDCDYSYLHVT